MIIVNNLIQQFFYSFLWFIFNVIILKVIIEFNTNIIFLS